MDSRLPAHVEVAALRRLAEQGGDMATILQRGDADRGAILLVIASRGATHSTHERRWTGERYAWAPTGPDAADSAAHAAYLARRRADDPDMWLIELDVADPPRFIVRWADLS